jgi:hypothetical protein
VLFRWTRGDATEGLWALEFDSGAGEVMGEAFLVEPDGSEATVDRYGTLAFIMNPQRSGQKVLARFGFVGDLREVLTNPHTGAMEFRSSPDGRKMAFVAEGVEGASPGQQLWVRDMVRGTE